MNSIMYFRDRHCRHKAYEILADHNFYLPYGEDCSLVDIEDVGYMVELLETSGFDMSKVMVTD